MAERLIFHYQPKQTVIHRIDPRVKISITFALTAGLFGAELLQLAVLGGYLAAAAVLAKLSFQRCRRELRFLFLLAAVIFVSRWISSGALLEGVVYGTRFLLAVTAGLVLTDTTAPEDLTLAVYWFIKPLRFLKPQRTASRFNLTVSFLPLIFDAAMEIQEARRSRLDSPFRRPLRRIISYAAQIFSLILQQAEEISYALEARLYDESILHGSIRFHRIDAAAVLITGATAWGVIITA
jgi:energy-coupling factor transporter transmembrane protein EcfT